MPTRLLISNVPFDCTDQLLKQWIEECGYRTLSVKLICDVVSGTSPSFAHVQLVDAAKLNEAERTLDGQTFRGRTLQVSRVVGARTVGQHVRSAAVNLR
jgi:RNA recognition motif-containing protein